MCSNSEYLDQYCADAQAGLGLRCLHRSTVWTVHFLQDTI